MVHRYHPRYAQRALVARQSEREQLVSRPRTPWT
jgi:hypothetical protein